MAQWLFPVYGFHHDSKYFPNPEKFDPERFSDENKHNIIPGTYLPFGIGPRNCIGKKILFYTIISQRLIRMHLFFRFPFRTYGTQSDFVLFAVEFLV